MPPKLPAEIVAQTIRDLDAFSRDADKLARLVAAPLARRIAPRFVMPEPNSEAATAHTRKITAEITPLPELLAAERKQLVADLLAARRKGSGGAPRKADDAAVRAFCGEKPSASTKRRAEKKFDISDRTLRRILTGRQN